MSGNVNITDKKPVLTGNGELMRLIDPTAKNKFTRSGDKPHRYPMRNLVLKGVTTSYPNYGHDIDTDGPYPE